MPSSSREELPPPPPLASLLRRARSESLTKATTRTTKRQHDGTATQGADDDAAPSVLPLTEDDDGLPTKPTDAEVVLPAAAASAPAPKRSVRLAPPVPTTPSTPPAEPTATPPPSILATRPSAIDAGTGAAGPPVVPAAPASPTFVLPTSDGSHPSSQRFGPLTELGANASTSYVCAPGDAPMATPAGSKEGGCMKHVLERFRRYCPGIACHAAKVSLSWTIQWCLVVTLTVLVVATALLFNYYALVLVNRTADRYLDTSLEQARSAVEQKFVRMAATIRGVSAAESANVTGTWSSWPIWAYPTYRLENATQARLWTLGERAAHVGAIESCRALATLTEVRLAYRLVRDGWIGGCMRPSVMRGAIPNGVGGLGVAATEAATVAMVLANGTVVWLQTVPGVTDTSTSRSIWVRAVEAMHWVYDRYQLRQLLRDVWTVALLPSTTRTLLSTVVCVDGLVTANGSAADPLNLRNTTWLLTPFDNRNGTLRDINIVQWVGGDVAENSNNNDDGFSFTVLNVSAVASITAALEVVSTRTSNGVSVELADEGTGGVLSWASAIEYYVPTSSYIETNVFPGATPPSNAGGLPSLAYTARTTWWVRVSSGDSVVGSLSRGTYVVLVVCIAIAIAVSVAGLMTLRLLLNPLEQVSRDIRHAAALKFARIDAARFPPSILREMNLVTRSFLRLVLKLRSYRSVLMDVYDTSLRSRSASGMSSMSGGDDGLSMNASFASSASSSYDSVVLPSSSTSLSPSGSLGGTADDEDLEFLDEIRRGSFADALDMAGGRDEAEEDDNQHLVKVQLAYISRRHGGRQRKQVTFEHTYVDGEAALFHRFQTDCLKSLGLSEFEEVKMHVQCNGVFVHITGDTQLSDAFAAARGELIVRLVKSSVKKVLSPFALLVDLVNFVVNIALIALGMLNTRAGTAARLSISVFFGLYATAFGVNLLITLALLKQGQRDPRMKAWLSQAGLEVSLMLIFCSLNTQNIHFLWSHWSLGLKYNAPRVQLMWKHGIQYSLFGFIFLDVMQILYKGYRVLGDEDLLELSIAGLLTACFSIALSLKKRMDFALLYLRRWLRRRRQRGQRNDVHSGDEAMDDGGANGAEGGGTDHDGPAIARRPRAGMSCPMFSAEATLMVVRLKVSLPDTARFSLDTRAATHGVKLAGQLNRFFTHVFGAVSQAEGHVLWFHGNEVAVVFNSPRPLEHHTHKALKCALGLQRILSDAQALSAPSAMGVAVPTTASAASNTGPVAVVALSRDLYVFGTLGSVHKKVFQCFADWDEMDRMLGFAESAGSVGIVASRRCATFLTGGDGAAVSPRHGAHGVGWRAVHHDVLGADQSYVELQPAVQRRGSTLHRDASPTASAVSVLSRVLCFLGIVEDPNDEALEVFTQFTTQFVSTARRPIPTEEAQPKRKAVKIQVQGNISSASPFGGRLAHGPERPFISYSQRRTPLEDAVPSALKKKTTSPTVFKKRAEDDLRPFGSDLSSEGEEEEDDAPGMSSETYHSKETRDLNHGSSGRQSGQQQGRGTNAVTLGSKDIKRLFPY